MELDPNDGAKLADIGVNVAKDIYRVVLDYSKASVIELDSIVAKIAVEGNKTEDVQSTLFVLGCYLGESLVRNAGGRWLTTVGTPMEGSSPYPLVVEITSTGAICSPIGKVFKLFENGPEDGLPAFYQAVEAYTP